jgi:hypothetical protein
VPTFETRADAEAYCREREREHPGTGWLTWHEETRWRVARTNLVAKEAATGTTTAAKPKPPEPEDPRRGLARDVPPYS